jgi:cell division protein FtsI (penicillin-binding protein 3)
MSNASGKKGFFRFFIIFSIAFSALILLYYAYLMLFSGERSKQYSNPAVSSSYQRGMILDRNGEVLALDVPYIRIAANPRQISDPQAASESLSRILGIPSATIFEQLSKDTGYTVLKKKIELAQKETIQKAIDSASLTGSVYIEQYEGRTYPSNFHAAQIIGFTDTDGNGIEGMELAMDSVLKAYPALERNISYGDDVYLTLDIQLQYLCDSVIQDMCEEHDPDYAVLVLLDAKTGEILCSVSYPWYNLNSYSQSSADSRQNKAFTYMYEPGSVFKVFSLASCMEAGTADFDSPYVCTGSRTFTTDSGQKLLITCHEPHGTLDYNGMIARSCNGAISNWALQTSDQDFYDGLSRFHFGTKYNLPLFNASGKLSAPTDWSFRSKPTISFGQEMMATPIQLAAAATAFTNSGMLVQPAIVSKVVDQDGQTVSSFSRTELGRATFEETAQKVLEAMILATKEGGTAIKTSVPGLEVAAKTGTAEILNSSSGAVTASTLAIFPADDPQYIVYVAASNPKGSTIWGANIASPAIGSLIDAMVSAGKLESRMFIVKDE